MWNNDVFRMLQSHCCLSHFNKCINEYQNLNDDKCCKQYEEMKYDTDRERRSVRRNRRARRVTGEVGGEEHWGHIECHCSQRRNQTVKESEESRITHSDQCVWTCCNRKWDKWICHGSVHAVMGEFA